MLTAFIPPVPSPTILRLPKCNIHTHLEGSVRPQTFLELAAQQNLSLPFDPSQILDYIQVNGSETSLVEYLDKIGVNYPILKDSTAQRRTAFEAVEDAYYDGVIYIELRAGPALHSSSGIKVDSCIENILAGLKDAEDKYGIVTSLIVAGLRNHDPKVNADLAKSACWYRDQGVVGFDLAGDEAGFPASIHQEAFEIVRDAGLPYTIHAGEASGAENVRYAVEVLGAARIGHGVRSIESTYVMELLRERQVLLEVCPTSNVHTGTVPSIQSHPVKILYDFGIPVSINDDDPVTSRTRTSNELMLMHSVFGMTMEDLIEIQLTTLEHSFYSDRVVIEELKNKVKEIES
ncbi:MAG: adenosine deaminase [Anaerolineaceae bacterium]|jgi:adenosine deaminase